MNKQVSRDPLIEESWKEVLKKEFKSEYFISLESFLLKEKAQYTIYPPSGKIFSSFNHTPFNQVKVVIIGQDPYHGVGQANGLCFSVNDGITIPPSLQNIFKEINNDLGLSIPQSGNLENWAKQGIFLLNTTLTVRANQAGSHQKQGWEVFTDAAIKSLSDYNNGLVFLLWGKFAQAKESIIDNKKHHILKAAHPSPFSAYSGFFGCKHFSKTNAYLRQIGRQEIDWKIN